jgi:hypothetical protein
MFSYGDCQPHDKKTLLLMENVIVFFLKRLMVSLSYISFWRIKNRPTVEDLYFFFRSDREECLYIKNFLTRKYSVEDIMEARKKKKFNKKKNFFSLKI